MISKNLFRFTIVFFMVAAICIFCVYDYGWAQVAYDAPMETAPVTDEILETLQLQPRSLGVRSLSEDWVRLQPLPPGLTPINASVSELFTPNRASLSVAPSIAPQFQMPYYDMFMQDSLMTRLPEMSRWSRSPGTPTEMFSRDLYESLRLWDTTLSVSTYAPQLIQPGWSPRSTEVVDFIPQFPHWDEPSWDDLREWPGATFSLQQPLTSNPYTSQTPFRLVDPGFGRNRISEFRHVDPQAGIRYDQIWQPEPMWSYGVLPGYPFTLPLSSY